MTFKFSASNGVVTITGYSGSVPNGKLTVPSKSSYGPVTIIGSQAFMRNNEIINVKIEKGIKTINKLAFYECKKLAFISIPETVATIGNHALRHADYEATVDITFTIVFEGKSLLNKINLRAIGTAKNVIVYFCGDKEPSYGDDIFYCASSVIIYSSTINSFCGVSTTNAPCISLTSLYPNKSSFINSILILIFVYLS